MTKFGAKMVPLSPESDVDAEELALAAEGILRLPEKKPGKRFWDQFWSTPAPRISGDIVAAVRADRTDG